MPGNGEGAAAGTGRCRSLWEPLRPGRCVEYAVDDQPGAVERARAFLADPAAVAVVTPRVAATVVLVSEGKPHYRHFDSPLPGGAPIDETVPADPVDVFMLRRASTMAFVPDAVVFPGGGMDAGDASVETPWGGTSPKQWAGTLGCDEERARAVVVCAARELFEESGVLLAATPDGKLPRDERGDHWAREREAVASRRMAFGDMLARLGLVLRSDWLRPRSHWVTPPCEPVRYDTYFFLASLPAGQHADGRTSEAVEAAWIAPKEALARGRTGHLKLMPPTVSNLASLARAQSVEAAWNLPFDGHVLPRPILRDDGEVAMGCTVAP